MSAPWTVCARVREAMIMMVVHKKDVHCKKSIRGRAPGQKSYSQEVISTLLDLVEDKEPMGANMRAEVYHQYQT